MAQRDAKGLWLKGSSPNPAGRAPLPFDVQELKAQSRVEMLRAMSQVLLMSKEELFRYQDPTRLPNESGAKILAARVLLGAISNGCPIRTQVFLNYILGKPKPYNEGEDEGRIPITLAYPRDPAKAEVRDAEG